MIDPHTIEVGRDGGATDTSDVFLATTAREEFWDATKRMVFLGDWCLRYSCRSVWEPLNAEVMPYLWNDKRTFHDTYSYLVNLYELVLERLVDIMNDLHATSHGVRYWRIVLGPWLYHYISVLYDRYVSIVAAFDRYPNASTICLDESCYVTPIDAAHFQGPLCRNDLYNLQLYSSIMTLLGRHFLTKRMPSTVAGAIPKSSRRSPKEYAKYCLSNVMQSVSKLTWGRDHIVSHASYFSLRDDMALYLKTLGRVCPYYVPKSSLPSVSIDTEKRKGLASLDLSSDEFQKVMVAMIVRDMPTSYVENYERVKRHTRKYPRGPRAILSGVSWHFNEEFRQWAARSAESGTLLLAVQHGGGCYGINPCTWISDHELDVTDKFYSWGWANDGCRSNVVSMTPSQLTGAGSRKVRRINSDILFGLSNLPRYLLRYSMYSQRSFLSSVEGQLQFADYLPERLRQHLKVRLYQADHGWDVRSRWQDRFSEVELEGWNIKFPQRLAMSRLYVADMLSTTYALSLSANKPTIVFIDSRMADYLPGAEEVFQNLRDVGILHYDPESAARMVENVYDNIDEWWGDDAVQRARKEYCDRFVRIADDPLSEWVEELKGV